MTPIELDEALSELETRLERVRALYEQYFMGLEKIPPEILRKDVERRIHQLRKEQIRNTAKRFKLQTLIQRHNTFQQYWTRISREIEEGTYRRHLERARRRMTESEALTVAAKRRAGAFGRAKKAEDQALSEDASTDSGETVADFEAALTAALGLGEDSLGSQSAAGIAARSAAATPGSTLSGAARRESKEPSANTGRALSEQLLHGPLSNRKPSPEQPARRTPWGSLSMPPVARTASRPPAQNAAPLASSPEPVAPPAAPSRAEATPAAGPRNPQAIPVSMPRTLAQAAQMGRGDPPPPNRPNAKSPVLSPGAAPHATAETGIAQTKPGRGPTRIVESPAKADAKVRPSAASPGGPPARAAVLRSHIEAAPQVSPGASRANPARPPMPNANAPQVTGSASTTSARSGAVDGERLTQLHQQLLEARRQTNDPTPITREGLSRKLEATAAKLRAEHGNRQIDFDVVIRDGRPIIKPKVI